MSRAAKGLPLSTTAYLPECALGRRSRCIGGGVAEVGGVAVGRTVVAGHAVIHAFVDLGR